MRKLLDLDGGEVPSSYLLSIPENIFLDELLANYPLEKKVPFARDYLVFILGLMDTLSDDFIYIHSDKLQSLVDNYKVLIDWLELRSILIIDKEYEIGIKPIGYKLSPEYLTPLKSESITKKTLIRRIINSEIKTRRRRERKFYTRDPDWVRPTDVANVFNLKRNLMLKGFRELGLLINKIAHHRGGKDELFYYEIGDYYGIETCTLKINKNFFFLIERLIKEKPNLFPSKN